MYKELKTQLTTYQHKLKGESDHLKGQGESKGESKEVLNYNQSKNNGCLTTFLFCFLTSSLEGIRDPENGKGLLYLQGKDGLSLKLSYQLSYEAKGGGNLFK